MGVWVGVSVSVGVGVSVVVAVGGTGVAEGVGRVAVGSVCEVVQAVRNKTIMGKTIRFIDTSPEGVYLL